MVSALVEAGADIDGLQGAINLDAAFELLEPELESDDVRHLDAAESDEAPDEDVNAEVASEPQR